MLLRRVIAHVRQQDWNAIAIDFVIVVIGVFVGLQASNWNEERAERALVRGHLAEIAQDLRQHLEDSGDLENSTRMRIAAVDYIYREAFDRRLPSRLMLGGRSWDAPPAMDFPPDQLQNLMGSVNLVRVSVRSRNGYESLISSGRLGLLRNHQLARDIQAYYGDYDNLLDTQTSVFRAFRTEGASQQYGLGLSVFDERPAADIVAMAQADPGFAAYLRSQREWAILNYNILRDIGRKTETLLNAIEAELAR